jgi:hypothetical protein
MRFEAGGRLSRFRARLPEPDDLRAAHLAAHNRQSAVPESMCTHTIRVWRVLTQNQHLAPSTQQAEQSWLNTRAGSEVCQSIFLKLTKDEK